MVTHSVDGEVIMKLSTETCNLLVQLVSCPLTTFDLSTRPQGETPESVVIENGQLDERSCPVSDASSAVRSCGVIPQGNILGDGGQLHDALDPVIGALRDGKSQQQDLITSANRGAGSTVPALPKRVVDGGLTLVMTSEVTLCSDPAERLQKLVLLPLSIVDWLCMGERADSFISPFDSIAALVGLGQPANEVPLGVILLENCQSNQLTGQTQMGSGRARLIISSTVYQGDTRWQEFAQVNDLQITQI